MTKPSFNAAADHPGRPSTAERIKEMIRVDHAGEYGAVRIYEGQLAVFRNLPHKKEITESLTRMAAEEEEHLDRFNKLVNERQVRPTALNPLWHIGGFAMGAATALMGEKAAHACTVAVESVIDEHYQRQIDELSALKTEEDLKETIIQFREEELAHKQEALESGAEEAPGYPVLSNVIQTICRAAIRASEKA
ncbi:MAG TPA: demethoxyubiquinone hydroxylase family protein [Rhodobiaceae bacterium]|nr:demethoxyubiquinone hydroxylase family protein [Rhodobiaceae bacterium]|tara:strand:- start:415 stop:993 length:579 start_codon:yes stop_codon:yes gene_type:complete